MREPTYLADFFKEHNLRPTSRGIQQELTLPAVSYETGEKYFQVQGARLWNSSPLPAPHSIILVIQEVGAPIPIRSRFLAVHLVGSRSHQGGYPKYPTLIQYLV